MRRRRIVPNEKGYEGATFVEEKKDDWQLRDIGVCLFDRERGSHKDPLSICSNSGNRSPQCARMVCLTSYRQHDRDFKRDSVSSSPFDVLG